MDLLGVEDGFRLDLDEHRIIDQASKKVRL